jgi:hypothetical protein
MNTQTKVEQAEPMANPYLTHTFHQLLLYQQGPLNLQLEE